MQPHRRRAGPAVEAESDWALAQVGDIILGVSHIKNAGFGRAVFEFEENRACGRGVLDFLAVNLERVFGYHVLFFGDRRLFFVFWFFRWLLSGFFRLRLRLRLLGQAGAGCEEQRSEAKAAKRMFHRHQISPNEPRQMHNSNVRHRKRESRQRQLAKQMGHG